MLRVITDLGDTITIGIHCILIVSCIHVVAVLVFLWSSILLLYELDGFCGYIHYRPSRDKTRPTRAA